MQGGEEGTPPGCARQTCLGGGGTGEPGAGAAEEAQRQSNRRAGYEDSTLG